MTRVTKLNITKIKPFVVTIRSKIVQHTRGGLRYVQTVHQLRAAKFQGPPRQYIYKQQSGEETTDSSSPQDPHELIAAPEHTKELGIICVSVMASD